MTTLRMIRRHTWTPLGTASLAAIVTAILMAGVGFPGSQASSTAHAQGNASGPETLAYLHPCLPMEDAAPTDQVLASEAEPAGSIELTAVDDEGAEAADPAPGQARSPSNGTKPQSYIAARSQVQSSAAAASLATNTQEATAPEQQPAGDAGPAPVEASNETQAPTEYSSEASSAAEPAESGAEGPPAGALSGDDHDAASGTTEAASGDDEPKKRSAYDLMVGGDPGDSAFRDPLYFNDPNAPHRSILKPGHTFEPKKPKDGDNGAIQPEEPNGEDPNGEDPNGEDPNGEQPAGPGQLIVQLATNTVEVVQISGDGGTNIAEIIQENIQIAFNIQLASMDDLPENLEVYLANLIASSGIFGGEVLGVEVHGNSGGGFQQIIQDGLNSIVVVQYAGDDGTNIVIIYQLNIQVAVNIQGRKRRCGRRRPCPAGPHPCRNPAHGDAARSLLWQL